MSSRLQIATRIHFALKRRLGASIEIETLLQGGDEAREVLWVCEGSGDPELAALADEFRVASRGVVPALANAPRIDDPVRTPAPRASRFQDSLPTVPAAGFESTLQPHEAEIAPQRHRWLPPRSWWRRAVDRAVR